MKLTAILKIAMRSLGRNPMRSILTMLGIIIGVGAVIAMMAVGRGAQSRIEEQIASLGTNVLMIFPGSSNQAGVRGGMGSMSSLTPDDLAAIKNQCSAVQMVSPAIRTGGQVVFADNNWATQVMGGTEEYFAIRNWRWHRR